MHLHTLLINLVPLIILIAHITTPLAHPLTKRTNSLTLSGLTLRAIHPLATLLPLQLAASSLEALYATLHLTAAAALSANHLAAATPSFTLTYGGVLEISFVAAGGRAVPWTFVRDFALVMRILSGRGYTGCYDQGYWDERGEFGVFVGLRLLAPLGLRARV